jgi:hypothetical protein
MKLVIKYRVIERGSLSMIDHEDAMNTSIASALDRSAARLRSPRRASGHEI